MKSRQNSSAPNGTLKSCAVMLCALQMLATVPQSAFAATPIKSSTTPAVPVSPITNVIVIIGENRTFDHVYGTYVPREDQSISNLWSKGIVTLNGTPGPNFSEASQYSAVDAGGKSAEGVYSNSPSGKVKYATLPPSLTGGAPKTGSAYGYPFLSQTVGELADPDLAPEYNQYLTTGATGLAGGSVDTRITSVNPAKPANGPYQLSGSKLPYDAYTSSPVHRFFQMWQQTDCSKATATATNPSGCLNDLFPWVEVTVGTGGNGAKQSSTFSDTSTGEGSTSMAFYNMYKGDAPYFKELADNYTISDNMHQSVMGGTGANHIMFGFADAIYYANSQGVPQPPFQASQVEDVNPQPGTNNAYVEDGYGTYDADGSPVGGGSYVNCSNQNEGGVAAITNYLESMKVKPNCVAGRYYLVNNYNPGYLGDGTVLSLTGSYPYAAFTIPPTPQKSIGDVLNTADVSWTYYGEGWDLYTSDPTGSNPWDAYCNICNPFLYQKTIMGNPAVSAAHLADTDALYEDIALGQLPAVSVVKPSGYNDGHPASSKLDLFEGFCKKIIDAVQANPTLWAHTAIFITEDEGGGYYDSGYIQPVDFFGDGTRIPLIIVSPYTQGGIVTHGYSDHVSLIKFIEKNWNLPVISTRSRDNLPNPTYAAVSTEAPNANYIPTNGPALDDLFDAFQFPISTGHIKANPAFPVAPAGHIDVK